MIFASGLKKDTTRTKMLLKKANKNNVAVPPITPIIAPSTLSITVALSTFVISFAKAPKIILHKKKITTNKSIVPIMLENEFTTGTSEKSGRGN